MRLIDADALINALNTLFRKQVTQFGYEGYEKADEKTQLVCDGISYSIGCVLDMPTVDPQPEITLESAIDYLHSIGWMQEHDELMYKQGYKHGKSKGIKRGMAMARRKEAGGD